jgi:hypothetical protein
VDGAKDVLSPLRSATARVALALYSRHPGAAGLRWWSSWEALWANVTVFDRAVAALKATEVTELTLDHPRLLEAADIFGLRVV